MSWLTNSLNDSLSSIKSQVNTLTKVLTEDEEPEDYADATSTELNQNKVLSLKQQIEETENRLLSSEITNAAKYNALLDKYKKAEKELEFFKNAKSNEEWGWTTVIGDKDDTSGQTQSADIIRLQNRLSEERHDHQTEISALRDKYQTQISELLAEIEAKKSSDTVEQKNDSTAIAPETLSEFQSQIENLTARVSELTEKCETQEQENNQLNDAMQELDCQHQQAIGELLKQKKELSEELKLSKAKRIGSGPFGEKLFKDVATGLESPDASDQSLDNLMDKNQLLMTEIDVLKENEPTKLPSSELGELRVKDGIISQLQMQLEKANMDIEVMKGEKKQYEDKMVELSHQSNLVRTLQEELSQMKKYHEIMISDKDSIIYMKDLELENIQEQQTNANTKISMLEKNVAKITQESENNENTGKNSELIEKLLDKLDLKEASDLCSSVSDMTSEVAQLRCERDKLSENLEATVKQLDNVRFNARVLENEKEDLERSCENLRDQLEEITLGSSTSDVTVSAALPTIQEEEPEAIVAEIENVRSSEDNWKEKTSKLSIQMRLLLDAKMSIEKELQTVKQENDQLRSLVKGSEKTPQTENANLTIDLQNQEKYSDDVISFVEGNAKMNEDSLKRIEAAVFQPSEHQVKIDELKCVIINKSDQLDALRQDIRDIGQIFGIEGENNRTIYVEIKKEHSKLQESLKEVGEQLETCQLELASKSKEFDEKCSQLEGNLQKKHNELQELKETNVHLKLQIENMNTKKEELEQKIEDLNEQLDNANTKKEEIEQKVEEINNTNEQLKKQSVSKQNALEELKEANVQLNLQLGNLNTKKGELEQKIEELNNVNKELKKQSSAKDNEVISELEDKLTQMTMNCDKVKEELLATTQKLESLENDNNETSEFQKSLNNSLGEANSKVEELSLQKQELEEELSSVKTTLESTTADLSRFSSERETLIAASTQKHQESLSYYNEITKLSTLINENKTKFEEELQQKINELTEKDETIASMEIKMKELSNQQSSATEQLQSLRNECQNLRKNVAGLRKERDQLLASTSSLNQNEEEKSKLIQSYKEKQKQLTQECNRLREHLVSVEDAYTAEAVQAEEREVTLKQTISKLHEKISTHANLYNSNNQKYTTELSTIKEKMENAIMERDDLVQKLQISEEVSFQHQEALKRLQQVLQDFQKSQSRDISNALDRERRKLAEEKKTSDELRSQITQMQKSILQLEEKIASHQSLESEVLSKDDTIVALKSQVHATQQAAKKSQDQVALLQSSSDGKIDKHLLRNLVVGYLATPTDKQHEVMRIIAQVLDFSAEERQRTGVDQQPGSWLTSVANFLAPPPSNLQMTRKVDALDYSSLSQAFIRFLEDESTIHTSAKLPAVQMADEIHKKAQKKSISLIATDSTKNSGTEGDNDPGSSSGNSFLDAANLPDNSQNIPLLVPQAEAISEPKFLKNLLESKSDEK